MILVINIYWCYLVSVLQRKGEIIKQRTSAKCHLKEKRIKFETSKVLQGNFLCYPWAVIKRWQCVSWRWNGKRNMFTQYKWIKVFWSGKKKLTHDICLLGDCRFRRWPYFANQNLIFLLKSVKKKEGFSRETFGSRINRTWNHIWTCVGCGECVFPEKCVGSTQARAFGLLETTPKAAASGFLPIFVS